MPRTNTDSNGSPNTDGALLGIVGETLHGDKWKSALARDLGWSHGYVHMLYSGQRTLNEESRQRISEILTGKLFEESVRYSRVCEVLECFNNGWPTA